MVDAVKALIVSNHVLLRCVAILKCVSGNMKKNSGTFRASVFGSCLAVLSCRKVCRSKAPCDFTASRLPDTHSDKVTGTD